MKSVHPAFYAALFNAPEDGIIPRWFLSFTARTWPDGAGNTSSQIVSFWSGDLPVTEEVYSLVSDAVEARNFIGGVDLDVDSSVSVSSLEVVTRSVRMTMLAPGVTDFVRGFDIRGATAEIWVGVLDPVTRLLTSRPEPDYLGIIDGAPVSGDGVDGDEGIEIRLVNDAMMMLTKPNPAKSSAEEQKKRTSPTGAADDFGKYAGAIASWIEPWGEK